jgi:hypothetical protein
MTVQQWIESAWSAILDDAPLLASPSEYRTMMYEAFWEGKTPKPRPQPKGKRGEKAPPQVPRASRGPSRSAIAELQAEAARIQAMQAEKQPSK